MKNKYLIPILFFILISTFWGCKTTGSNPGINIVDSEPLKKVPIDAEIAATAIITHLRGDNIPDIVHVKFDPGVTKPEKTIDQYQSFAINGHDLLSYKQAEKKPEQKLTEGILHLRDWFGRNSHLHYKAFYEVNPDQIVIKKYAIVPLSHDNPDFRLIAVDSETLKKAPKEIFKTWESLYTFTSRHNLFKVKVRQDALQDRNICLFVFFLDPVKESSSLKLLLAEEKNTSSLEGVSKYSSYFRFKDRPLAMVQGKLFSNSQKPLYVKMTLKKDTGFLSTSKIIFNKNIKELISN